MQEYGLWRVFLWLEILMNQNAGIKKEKIMKWKSLTLKTFVPFILCWSGNYNHFFSWTQTSSRTCWEVWSIFIKITKHNAMKKSHFFPGGNKIHCWNLVYNMTIKTFQNVSFKWNLISKHHFCFKNPNIWQIFSNHRNQISKCTWICIIKRENIKINII